VVAQTPEAGEPAAADDADAEVQPVDSLGRPLGPPTRHDRAVVAVSLNDALA
jgi:hypothetical protein